MDNYGVKLRKPEELPDFDQPVDMDNYGVKLRKPEELPDFDQPVVTMFAKANTLRQVGCRSSEASRLRPHGKPPQCFS